MLTCNPSVAPAGVHLMLLFVTMGDTPALTSNAEEMPSGEGSRYASATCFTFSFTLKSTIADMTSLPEKAHIPHMSGSVLRGYRDAGLDEQYETAGGTRTGRRGYKTSCSGRIQTKPPSWSCDPNPGRQSAN